MPKRSRVCRHTGGSRPVAGTGSVSHQDIAAEPVDDAERKFLEPVARYVAILQEWSLERPSDGTGTVPQSEQL